MDNKSPVNVFFQPRHMYSAAALMCTRYLNIFAYTKGFVWPPAHNTAGDDISNGSQQMKHL